MDLCLAFSGNNRYSTQKRVFTKRLGNSDGSPFDEMELRLSQTEPIAKMRFVILTFLRFKWMRHVSSLKCTNLTHKSETVSIGVCSVGQL